jgi:2,3-diaminopropionate biosynthesis protein SbnA
MDCKTLTALIGNTPLVRINSLCDDTKRFRVFGKLESLNPGYSVKDRSARGLLEQAIKDHDLKPGATIVESSSGNMGHALAMLCAMHRFRFICVLDPKTPKSNTSLVEAFGGKVVMIDTPDATGSFQKRRIATAKRIAQEMPNCINLDQYNNPAAIEAHYRTTGPELLRQTRTRIDVLIGTASTGSHLSGTAKFLKEKLPNIKVIGVEPVGSVVFGGTYQSFLQNGTGLSFRPGNIREQYIDEVQRVADVDAFRVCRELAKRDGLLLGGSSGSVLHVAAGLRAAAVEPCNVVVILPDGGLKYLETIYDNRWLIEHGLGVLVDSNIEKLPLPQPEDEQLLWKRA